MGNFVPAVGMVGGAIMMIGTMFNPPTKVSRVKFEVENKREELQSSLLKISSDLTSIGKNLSTMKSLAMETFEIVVDLKYKEGIDLIDSSYNIFLKGLKNFEKTHTRFTGFIMELETKADLSFKEENIRELLTKAAKSKGKQRAKHLATYIFIVRAKFLQIVTAYYLYDEDTERVEEEFAAFNRDVKILQVMHEKIFGEAFQPREPFNWEGQARKVACVSEMCSQLVPL